MGGSFQLIFAYLLYECFNFITGTYSFRGVLNPEFPPVNYMPMLWSVLDICVYLWPILCISLCEISQSTEELHWFHINL